MEVPRWFFKLWLVTLAGMALLALIYFAALRPAIMRWGATDAEVSMVLPGDPLIIPGSPVSTRAITIHATPEVIWPWLAQIGTERGGFYSYAWLENLFAAGMDNAAEIRPEWQLTVGDRVSFMDNGPAGTFGQVAMEKPNEYLILPGWAYYLQPAGDGVTRLVVRYSTDMTSTAIGKIYYYVAFEPIHFLMESGMMMGLKQRAEAAPGGRP